MKSKFILTILFAFLFCESLINRVNAQGNNFKLDGNNNGTTTSKLGFTNNADLKIVTSDSVRATFKKEGDVIIEKDLTVKGIIHGKFISDSLNIGSINVDSINALNIIADSLTLNGGAHIYGALHIGNNSLTLGGTFVPPGINPNNNITSSEMFINFGGNDPLNPNFTDITLNIGNQNGGHVVGMNLIAESAIRISNSSFGYWLGDYEVLQWHGDLTTTPSPTNIFVGAQAGVLNSFNSTTFEGQNNTFMGFYAGYANNLGSENTCMGSLALNSNRKGHHNTAIGFLALCNNSNVNTSGIQGNYNTAVGNEAGLYNQTGNENTFIGNNANPQFENLHNATAIGANSRVDASDCMVLGSVSNINGALTTVKVGIGTTIPKRRLEVFDTDAPQLRLTRSSGFLGGRFTDFETTPDGNLKINPYDAMMWPLNGRVGINMAGGLEPQNTLEITSGPTSPSQSGLRFTNLTWSSQPIANGGNMGVLSVNNEGDVIYVPVTNFGTCSAPTTFTSGISGTISLSSNNNFFFKGQVGGLTSAISSVGIGYDCVDPLYAKFNVRQEQWYGDFASAKYSFAGSFINETNDLLNMSGGIYCYENSNTRIKFGIWSRSLAYQGTTSFNYGIIGHATQAIYQTVGVWGYAPVGTNSYAGYFDGDVYVNGSQFQPGYVLTGSDSVIKENITNIPNALQTITALEPHSFNFRNEDYPYLNLPDGVQYGLLAQEVENILPELVKEVKVPEDIDTAGNVTNHNLTLKTLNYIGLIPIAVQAIKELDRSLSPLVAAEAATPLFPPTGAVNINPDGAHFLWSDVEGAVSYFLEFSSDPQFGVTEGKTTTQFVINDTLQAMYKEVMQPHTTYYWRVHTIKASGVYTSQVYTFTTAAAAPTVLIEPANGATGVNNTLPVNFTWHAVSGASSYRIDVSTDSTFAGYGGENFTTYLGDTSIALSLSAYNTDYFWRVSYYTGQGQSQPSEVWRFTTLSPAIDAAVLEAPAANATGVPLTAFDFVWHPARGAVNYMLVLSTTPDPSGVIHTVNTTDTLQRFYSPTGLPLFCGETYYWCVLSYNAWGFSAMSEIRSFTFEAAGENPPLAPLSALPNNDDTLGGQLTLAWHPVPNAYDYQLFVSTTPNPVGMVLMQGVKNDTVYTIKEGLNANTRYYWWVTARNFCGTTGASSEIRAFYFIDFGMLQAQSVSELSDSVLKTNVAPITDALVKIQQLDGVSFDWDTLNYPWINFDKSRQLGLIAQEVQPVFPEVVKTDGLGFNYIEYNRLVPVLIEAIKELNGKVEELQAVVSNCCSSTKTTENTGQIPNEGNTPPRQTGSLQAPLTTTDVVLESPAAILYQNVPNPFGEGTAIRYYLPGNIKSAVMVFYNEYGQEIKSVALTESGAGQLNISSVNLAAGIYTYSLVVDGKVCDTKKMMKAR